MNNAALPSKVLPFKVKDSTYEINFPNNRQFIAIQNLKSVLAPNYETLGFMGAESEWAQSLVEVEAHLTILCPQLIKDLSIKFGDLTLLEGKEIVQCYADQFRPWYNEWLNFIFKSTKEEDTTTTTTIA